jgi:enamine deaminase RidA (YjgF/YER057c/UK114 family)
MARSQVSAGQRLNCWHRNFAIADAGHLKMKFMHRLLLLSALLCASLQAEIQRINPKGLTPSKGYTHTVVAKGDKTIYISGQVAMDASGKVVGRGDLTAQVTQVFENLKTALAAAGATFNDVVKLNYYIVNLKPDSIATVRQVRDKYLPGEKPASTAVGVQALVSEDYLIEIDAIAVK